MSADFVIAGSSHDELVDEVISLTDLQKAKHSKFNFADGELVVKIETDLSESRAVIIHSTSPPVNDHLVELLFYISCAKANGAREVLAVVPYFGYSRQDKKFPGWNFVTMEVICRALGSCGLNRLLLFDIHAEKSLEYFPESVQVTNLSAVSLGVDFFKPLGLKSVKIVSPDLGGLARARQFHNLFFEAPAAFEPTHIIKQRVTDNEVHRMELIGSVAGHTVIIVDDIIDTASTLVKAVDLLLENGAIEVYCFATHGIFSKNAIELISQSRLKRCVVTNSIRQMPEVMASGRFEVLSLGPLIANQLRRAE